MTTFSRQNDAGSRVSIKKIRTRSRSRLGTEIVLPCQRDVTPLLPTVLAGSIQTMNKCSYFNLAVASFLEGRQGDQCMHRYTQTLQMVRKGKWTEEEDEVIPPKREGHECILVLNL